MGRVSEFFWRRRDVDVRRSKAKEVSQEIVGQIRLSPLCSDYENLFAQVRPFINEMVLVRPFGVGRNGAKLPMRNTPELAVLNDPNEQMSWADFADLMFATFLTEDELNIHCHHKNGNVYGYSIIPKGSKYYIGGKPYWQILKADGEIQTIGRDEVMTIYFSRSPEDPYKGVSPATASRIAAQLDDLAFQYEKAYFENGAIPATLTFITASSRDKYEEKREELERGLKGAKNRNKTVFLWRAYQPETGATMDEVEVKTIQAPNNTLAIKDIVSIINDRLNKAVGVSNFILGDDSSAKYDNAELSDHQFTKRRIFPALTSFWAQFQHELDRITGGLGYAIQFEMVIPELTARAETKSQTAQRNAESLLKLIEAGATPVAAIEALELDSNWLAAARNIFTKSLTAEPMVESVKKKTDEVACKCHRCEEESTKDYFTPFSAKEKKERQIYERLMSYADAIAYENPDLNPEEVVDSIVEILLAEAELGGEGAAEAILELVDDEELKAEIKASVEEGTELSDPIAKNIRTRTNSIVEQFGSQVRVIVRAALENSEALSAEEIKERLAEVMPEANAARIARNETIYAFRAGRLEQSLKIAKKWDLKMGVKWVCRHDDKTCDICAALDGQVTMLGEPFPESVKYPDGYVLPNGRIVGPAPAGATAEEKKKYTGTDTFGWEQDMWSDYGVISHCHVNCRCTFSEFVILDKD